MPHGIQLCSSAYFDMKIMMHPIINSINYLDYGHVPIGIADRYTDFLGLILPPGAYTDVTWPLGKYEITFVCFYAYLLKTSGLIVSKIVGTLVNHRMFSYITVDCYRCSTDVNGWTGCDQT